MMCGELRRETRRNLPDNQPLQEREDKTRTTDSKDAAAKAEEVANNGVPFEEKMAELNGNIYEQTPELKELDAVIRQNRKLAALRDTLLPKLLSGEVEALETEKVGEGAP